MGGLLHGLEELEGYGDILLSVCQSRSMYTANASEYRGSGHSTSSRDASTPLHPQQGSSAGYSALIIVWQGQMGRGKRSNCPRWLEVPREFLQRTALPSWSCSPCYREVQDTVDFPVQRRSRPETSNPSAESFCLVLLEEGKQGKQVIIERIDR